MAHDEAYRKAKDKIEEALKSGASRLDLSAEWNVLDSEKLTELPELLSQLTQLEALDLSNTQLTALPKWLGQFTKLRSLSLCNTQLTKLPEWLSNLTQLESLYLSGNGLTVLPAWSTEFTALHTLDISQNQITALPEWFTESPALEDLDISGNRITSIPESLTLLKRLRSLRVAYNQLSTVPKWIESFKNLRTLHLGGNGLADPPECLVSLTGLEELHLNESEFGKSLTAVTKCFEIISKLPNLNTLFFSGNHLNEVEDNLSEVLSILAQSTSLMTVYFSRNQLSKLPDEIIWNAELMTLGLGNNRLTDIPASLGRLLNLRVLDLTDNPLNPELAAAADEGIDAVKRYLRSKAEAQIVLNQAKLILVGEGEVGKSCLLGALRNDAWDESRLTTHGIEIKSVEVTDSQTDVQITLNGWDFGGQRVYRPTHQLFFSAPAVYLVVWKPREGPQQGFVKDWIKLIKHREPDAKILVVATHGGPKERQPDIDRQEIWDLFGRDTVIDFFHVDSKPLHGEKGPCRGIEELKHAIAKVASSLPEVGRSVPKRWQEVREALKETGEAYLPLDQVLIICEKRKMSEEQAQDFVRISHRLGHLIYYGHDPRLKDMVILKPDWLATAVSFVLDDEDTRKKHGLVKFSRLSELWSARERAQEFQYPPQVHPIFVALMERFDLSYRVAGSPLGGELEETSLIAQLVPDVRPVDDISREWSEELQSGDEQQIQICRIVDDKGQSGSAEGLFYQLIVRLHKFSLGRDDFNKSVHWQRGLILDDDYNGRALLEHDGNDVRITVRAAYPGNLLAVLTREVKWLVENFWEGLKCQVVVPCIEPCGKHQPGRGMFEVQKLVAFKRQGMQLFPCTVSGCDQAHNIGALLQNAPDARRPSIESLITQGFAELREQTLELNQNQKRMMSQADDIFRGVMRAMIDEGRDGPRLFSLVPVETSKFNPNGWAKKKFRVTLWCEHTRLPLPLLNNSDDQGVYEFEVTREWFATAAPFLKVLTGTLSLVLPVAASATKLALDETIYKGLERQLDLGKSCAEAMFKSTEKTADWLSEKEGFGAEQTGYIRAQGSVLREFQTWLKKEDPGFGDLRKVLNKQQEFLWVHRDYEDQY